MRKNYISKSEISSRMFKSDWLELLSKVHFMTPVAIYMPVIIYFLYKAFYVGSFAWYYCAAFFVSGIIAWSLAEYIIHRFVFHYELKSKIGKRVHFIFHGVHHDYPDDALRLVMPPIVSIPLAALFYFLFRLILDTSYVEAMFPGFVAGYLFYDLSHYALHHYSCKNKFWLKLKKHHILHHYKNMQQGYGVSSKLWDVLFGTDF